MSMLPPTMPQLEMGLREPTAQRRWTVLIRGLLVVPHVVVLAFLTIAAEVVTFLAWFAALFTGRNPFHSFVAGVYAWNLRVSAYLYFLTDVYPPFSLEIQAPYVIEVQLDQGPLNRAKVFFRSFLALPALLLSSIATAGLAGVLFVTWLVTLVLGRLPRPLHQATIGILRFSARTNAYWFLLQDRYPAGLFGDTSTEGPSSSSFIPTGPSAFSHLPPPPTAVAGTSPFPQPTPLEQAAPLPGLPVAPPVNPTWTATPTATTTSPFRHVFTGGAKALVALALVLGCGVYLVYGAIVVAAFNGDDQAWSNDHYAFVLKVQDDLSAAQTSQGPSLFTACTALELDSQDFQGLPPTPGFLTALFQGISKVSLESVATDCADVTPAGVVPNSSTLNQDLTTAQSALQSFVTRLPAPQV